MNAAERADLIRDELKDTSACPRCGFTEPTRLEAAGCENCAPDAMPRCDICGRWVGDGLGWLPGYRWVRDEKGNDMRICAYDWETVR